jgi:hypothetical protein
LEPGRFRTEYAKYVLVEDPKGKEKQMNQDFKILSASSLPGKVVEEDLYFLMQHYGMPTRLLDWSTSALTAVYFASDDI